ncbi:MAG: hypothetical protein HEQ40_06490 [Lacibacter sp.]|jgi:hypothetical protein
MVSFARFYNKDNQLVNISMNEIETLISNEENKVKIAEFVYERLYNRFLKIFSYKSGKTKLYLKGDNQVEKDVFSEEYKNGFIMMASCSLLIETLGSYLLGVNETPKYKSVEMFDCVFKKADTYGNELRLFLGSPFYKKIRCGLLHQGEIYGSFKIVRQGELLKENKINATRFYNCLSKLLTSYKIELINSKWDSEVWDCCRNKIRYIVSNSRE